MLETERMEGVPEAPLQEPQEGASKTLSYYGQAKEGRGTLETLLGPSERFLCPEVHPDLHI